MLRETFNRNAPLISVIGAMALVQVGVIAFVVEMAGTQAELRGAISERNESYERILRLQSDVRSVKRMLRSAGMADPRDE